MLEIISIDNDYFWNNFSQDYDPESKILEIEKREEVGIILENMKETFRTLLILKYELNLNYKEISLLLGMKVETVRTYLYRARIEFKDMWRDLYE